MEGVTSAPDGVTAAVYTQIVYDGLGRKVSTLQCMARCSAGGTVVSRTDTQYDFAGRVSAVSNPYATGTPVWTTTAYDALSRPITVTRPDSSQVQTKYDVSSSLLALSAQVTDEAGKVRTTYTDGFGRLIKVNEDPSGLNYWTTYTYDGLDNLLTVAQGGQTRTFTYDMLGRLLTATNPESGLFDNPALGWISDQYTYDLNGNLLTKTDARTAPNFTVQMQYDALNRVLSKTYASSLNTSTVQFCYDGQLTGLCGTGVTGRTGVGGNYPNEIGYLTAVGNANSYSQYLHEGLGLVSWSQQVTNGQTYVFQQSASGDGYVYDSGGRLTDVWYPSGRHLTYGFDPAERVNSVGLSGAASAYVSNVGYEPSGAVNQMAFRNKLCEQTSYNNRLQPSGIRLGTGPTTTNCVTVTNAPDVVYLAFTYGSPNNNGNLLSQTITAPTTGGGTLALTQQYQYDGVNRLGGTVSGLPQNSVTESAAVGGPTVWSIQDGYDQYGNHLATASPASLEGAEMPTAPTQFNEATNQIQSTSAGPVTYDAVGEPGELPARRSAGIRCREPVGAVPGQRNVRVRWGRAAGAEGDAGRRDDVCV